MTSFGKMSVALTSASISSFLEAASCSGIKLCNVEIVDDLNVRISIKMSDYSSLQKIANMRGDDLHILQNSKGFSLLHKCVKRPIILLFFILWLFLVLFLPSRILFLHVEGNQTVSDFEILETAKQYGVKFGVSRRYVKSEKVKNAILAKIDRLKWVGVNTRGCVATISVKEGAVPERKAEVSSFANLVASVDGVITEITVTSGNPLCKVGQAVRKGQMLVSGYTDCGLYIKSGKVDGEIIGITKREISATAMYPRGVYGDAVSVKANYLLQVGKNIIKLKKYSGILGTGCVKMYEKKNLVLPGGFQLPLSIIVETMIEYERKPNPAETDQDFKWIEEAASKHCKDSMIAGEILRRTAQYTFKDNVCNYTGYYICREMISKIQTEERAYNGKGDN